MNDTRDRIIKAAGHLFYTQGFQGTTIKQICSLANVPVGSIYHFFESKCDILSEVNFDVYDVHKAAVDTFYKDCEITNEFRYCAITMCMFYSTEQNANACSLTMESYRDWKYFSAITSSAAETNFELFCHYVPEKTLEDFYLRTLFVQGGVYSFLTQRYYGSRISFTKRMCSFYKNALSSYFVPQEKIDETVSEPKLRKLIEDVRQIVERLGYREYGI